MYVRSVLSYLKREAQPSVLDNMIKHDCSSVLKDFKYAALIVMLNRMQHYIKNTNERDRLYKVSS